MILPKTLVRAQNLDPNFLWLRVGKVRNGGSEDITLGMPFFERYYVAFDLAGKKIGIASTDQTEAVVYNCGVQGRCCGIGCTLL